MGLVLGVEGDGAHTHAVLTDSSGTLLGLGANDDSSDWDSVGIAAAAAALRSCITEAVSSAGSDGDAVESAVFGLAGVDFPVDEKRLGGIPEAIGLKGRFRIINDSFAALRAGTDDPFGVVIVAGNGSVVAGRNPEGVEYRSLGLGRLYGDFGSETDISESALTAVAEAFIGLGPQTSLTTLLCESAGVSSVVDLVDGTARGRIDTTLFTPVVMAAAAGGDPVARGLLSHAGAMLGASAVHVVRTLHMEQTAFDLVLARHLFDSDELFDAVRSCVHPIAPQARLSRLAVPPVIGAALLAVELAGSTPSSDARSTLAGALAPALATPLAE
ncbi:MAG: BadF/BadG/BcrA/BcrD ATPase family protein [Actinomycetota bacterium]